MKPLLYLLITTLFLNSAKAQYVFTNLGLPTLSIANESYNTKRWVEMNGKIYFTNTTYQYGTEIWETDGTPGGTKILKDIYHDYWSGVTAVSMPMAPAEQPDLIEYNGKMHFSATDSTHGIELWYSDGTNSGTQMLIDIMPGRFRGCYFAHSAVYNGRLYFSADSNQYQGKEPWVTDGTALGTYLLKDINTAFLQTINSSNPRDYHQNFGLLFFFANTTNAITTLYQTNGTTIGTVPVMTDTMPPNLQYSGAPVINSKTIYISNDKLWAYDGSYAGMKLLNAPGLKRAQFMKNAIVYNGKLYFAGEDSTKGYELWVTDGTLSGTTMFKEIRPGSNGSGPGNFIIHKGLLYFTASDTTTTQLWSTDGTLAGTTKLTNSFPQNAGYFKSVDDKLFFTASNSWNNRTFHYTDGTDAGTHIIMPPTTPGDSSHTYVAQANLGYVIKDRAIYVYGKYDTTWYNLWKIEDTSTIDTGTSIASATIASQLAVDIYPNPAHTHLSVKTATAFKHGMVNITDITGRTIQTAAMQQGTVTQIPLNNIAPGVYMVDVWLDERRKTQKLIVQ